VKTNFQLIVFRARFSLFKNRHVLKNGVVANHCFQRQAGEQVLFLCLNPHSDGFWSNFRAQSARLQFTFRRSAVISDGMGVMLQASVTLFGHRSGGRDGVRVRLAYQLI
jgi:hypothetical protein